MNKYLSGAHYYSQSCSMLLIHTLIIKTFETQHLPLRSIQCGGRQTDRQSSEQTRVSAALCLSRVSLPEKLRVFSTVE